MEMLLLETIVVKMPTLQQACREKQLNVNKLLKVLHYHPLISVSN